MSDWVRKAVEVRAFDGYRVKGVFAPLRDLTRFGEVRVENHTVSSPNDLDLAPEVLYSKASGRPLSITR